MKFARGVFLVAGVFGVILLAPMFFMEGYWGRQYPPAVEHPEFFYGFVGTAFAWQLAYLLVARDPLRYRALMPLAAAAKTLFGLPACILVAFGRVTPQLMFGAGADLLFAALFLVAYWLTRSDALGRW